MAHRTSIRMDMVQNDHSVVCEPSHLQLLIPAVAVESAPCLLELLHLRLCFFLLLHLFSLLSDSLHQLLLQVQSLLHNSQQLRRFRGVVSLSEQQAPLPNETVLFLSRTTRSSSPQYHGRLQVHTRTVESVNMRRSVGAFCRHTSPLNSALWHMSTRHQRTLSKREKSASLCRRFNASCAFLLRVVWQPFLSGFSSFSSFRLLATSSSSSAARSPSETRASSSSFFFFFFLLLASCAVLTFLPSSFPRSRCVCHTNRKRCLHTRRFGTLAGLPPHVRVMPWGPHLPGQPASVQ